MVTGFNSVCIRRFAIMVQFDLLWFDFIAGYNLASSGETHPIAIMPSSRMLHEIVQVRPRKVTKTENFMARTDNLKL